MNSKVISLKTHEQVENLRRANRIVAEILATLAEKAQAGMSTLELDEIAVGICDKYRVKPAFRGLYGFPKSLCISLNNEVVHGIPRSDRFLKEGDLVSVDFGVIYEGFYGDAAISFGIGKVAPETQRLMDVTEQSLYRGIEQARVNNRLNDISSAIQRHVESNGFSVVREFVGHGIGSEPHEAPQIPNYWDRGFGPRLKAGMVFALEPMVTAGDWRVKILSDDWTAVTVDGSLSAHFEHSIVITEDGPEILSKLE